MSLRIFIAKDSTAQALGAEAVARAFAEAVAARGLGAEIVRTSARGLYWLEPLVEIDAGAGRVGYGPLTPQDVAGVLDAAGGAHPKALGRIEDLDFLKRQQRLIFARAGADRSALAQRLRGTRRSARASPGVGDRRGGDGQDGAGVRAARARRRGVPDGDQMAHGGGGFF